MSELSNEKNNKEIGSLKEEVNFGARQNSPGFSIPRKTKEKLNIRFKFNDSISKKKSDEILFRVFDIFLNPQKEECKKPNKDKQNNENNGNSNNLNKT